MALAVALIFVAGAGLWLVSNLQHDPRKAWRAAALGVGLAAASVCGLVAFGLLHPGAPLAAGSVAPGGAHLTAPAEGPVALLVKAHLPGGETGAAGHYHLDVRAGERKVGVDGKVSERWETRRVARKASGQVLVTHDENLHELPRDLTGVGLDIEATEVAGAIQGPLEVTLVHAPPSERSILIACGVLLGLGTVVDALGDKARVLPSLGSLLTYAALLPVSARPDSGAGTIGMVAALAVMLGAAGAGLLGRFLPRRKTGEPRGAGSVA